VIARCDASNAVKKRVLLASKAQAGGTTSSWPRRRHENLPNARRVTREMGDWRLLLHLTLHQTR